MKNKLMFFSLIFSPLFLFGQEKETVVIKKATHLLYRGTLKETNSWYLLIDEGNNYFLARIDRPTEEVYDWFCRFKDSQNIYKAKSYSAIGGGFSGQNSYNTLHFTKENEPSDILNFYIDRPDKKSIVLTGFEDNTIYRFQIVE
jgi:hypothetical protein